ncbi:MAG: acyl-ACP--UDP-N-acetylglucosamine O-acyltransferase [Candidatus Eisenbacteria sp.]|nr:acyl-ACP--UDP-N-acetylglucosamine O-acyltransferase [Candidatus Eisenbacteria bacterium]
MIQIDHAAIVAPGAELGVDVDIGPYCIVGPEVQLGDRCRLHSMVRIDGRTIIGQGCEFFHSSAIGGEPQDLKYRGAPSYLQIGARNTFREFCTVNRATAEGEATIIGNDNLIMAYAHVAHNCVMGNHTILANAANLAGHVEMGDFAIIGGVTPVHQFVRIGPHSIIGGGCRVPKDVPPFVKAAGNPLHVFGLNTIGLQRRGFSAESVNELKKLYRIFFRLKLVKEKALERIRVECRSLPEIKLFCDFVERSERGLTR